MPHDHATGVPDLRIHGGGSLNLTGSPTFDLKTRVCDDIGQEFNFLARQRGITPAELLRLLIIKFTVAESVIHRLAAKTAPSLPSFVLDPVPAGDTRGPTEDR